MGNEILVIVVFTILALGVGFAWVGGYLDKYQSQAQAKALDAMGENKASYGLKSTLKGQRIGNDENINNLQDNVSDQAGGLVGKGGIAEVVGGGLSKGL
ncbi:hypothetical protein MMC07_004524 [Pseudocyphellaria aurata]|nr:hypothetical protein [Pseudocyphellaria aurata]